MPTELPYWGPTRISAEVAAAVADKADQADVTAVENDVAQLGVDVGAVEVSVDALETAAVNHRDATAFDPVDYGADPTGATDSTDAWNDCIAAAIAAGVTRIRTEGKYLIDSGPILLPKDFTIEGPLPYCDVFTSVPARSAGEDGLIFFAGDDLDGPVILGHLTAADRGDPAKWLKGFILRNFQVYGNKAGRAGKLHPLISIWQPGEGAIIENVAVNYSTEDGIRIEGDGNPVRLYNISAFHNDGFGVSFAAFSGGAWADEIKGDSNGEGILGVRHEITYAYGTSPEVKTGSFTAHIEAACSSENSDAAPVTLYGFRGSLVLRGGKHTWGASPGASLVDLHDMTAGQEPSVFIDHVAANNLADGTYFRYFASGVEQTAYRRTRLALTNSAFENVITDDIVLSTQTPTVTLANLDGDGVLNVGASGGAITVVREQFASAGAVRSITPYSHGKVVFVECNSNNAGKSYATFRHNNAPSGYASVWLPNNADLTPNQRVTICFVAIGGRWKYVGNW